MVASAPQQRRPADDERHHAADESHRREEVLAADERRHRDRPEEAGHDHRDRGQADPLEGRSPLAGSLMKLFFDTVKQ